MMQLFGTLILLGVLIAGVFLYTRTASLEREIREVMARGRASGHGQGGNGVQAGGRAGG